MGIPWRKISSKLSVKANNTLSSLNKRHLATLDKKDQYEFEADNTPIYIEGHEQEGLFYELDGRKASVTIDYGTNNDKEEAENAAAFLDGELEEEEFVEAHQLESDVQELGYTALYRNGRYGEDVPVHVFEPTNSSYDVEVYVDRTGDE